MASRGLQVVAEVPLPLVYRELRLECAYRMDFVVEGDVVVEIKSVERIEKVHISQLITYLKLSRLPNGILLNFNVPMMIEGIRRVYRDYPS